MKEKSDLHIYFVADDVAIFDKDVPVLDPGTLYIPQRSSSASNAELDGVLEAGRGDRTYLNHSRNCQIPFLP
jgi:hypothetical protein